MNSDPSEGNIKLPKILLNGNNICMVRSNDLLEHNGLVLTDL
jgi:glutaredoxin